MWSAFGLTYKEAIMVKITMIKDAEGHLKGDVILIKNNDAHRLIDGGFAKTFTAQDKMMRPKKKGGRKWR